MYLQTAHNNIDSCIGSIQCSLKPSPLLFAQHVTIRWEPSVDTLRPWVAVRPDIEYKNCHRSTRIRRFGFAIVIVVTHSIRINPSFNIRHQFVAFLSRKVKYFHTVHALPTCSTKSDGRIRRLSDKVDVRQSTFPPIFVRTIAVVLSIIMIIHCAKNSDIALNQFAITRMRQLLVVVRAQPLWRGGYVFGMGRKVRKVQAGELIGIDAIAGPNECSRIS